MSKRRGNMANISLRQQADIERERAMELIRLHPGITMQGIADKLGRSKSSTYQYVATLIGCGKVTPVAQAQIAGQRGVTLGYYEVEEGFHDPRSSKFDYPTQIIVAAVDHASDVPSMDYTTALLFGRIKETA